MALHDEELPSRIDRYEPLKKLATGGMAEIYLAKQGGLEGFEKVVVLKRILPHLASDEEFVNMFLDEARIAAKLSHPNVVQIYDLGKADNTYYIAMEYVSGRNVQHLITKQQTFGGYLPVEHVCRIIAGVCDGLHYAHARKDYDGKPLNIIHRDISPQNILVSFAGGVKVVDFGIAKASTQLAQTRAGVLKGKYAYMSPEQVRGSKIDHRSDIFAVGLVMYEMLTGARAFERENSLKTLKAIVQEKPLNPRELNPDIPMEVVKILSKALEKNPDRRYKNAQEFQLALEDWLEASPKKSNNVRLSRFLYELFDDELNSAEGTMVVKGVGQVIIPTSRQGKEPIKPAIEDEVDSKTLTAALVDDGPDAPLKPAAPRVKDELSARAKAPTPALKQPTPPPDLDDDDGKTMPGVDLEQVERDRAAREAEKQRAQARSAPSPQPAPPPPPAAPARNPNQTMEADAVAEDEDKTRAGVPMSGPNPVAPALREPTRDRQRPMPKSTSSNDDARARDLLERVEAMAPQTQQTPRAAASTMSLPDDDVSVPDATPMAPPMAPSPPMSAENLLRPMAAEGSFPAPRPDEHTNPGIDTPDNLLSPAAMVQAQPARWPPAFMGLVAASVGMAAMAVLLFGVGAVAFPSAVPATDFGVVMVTTTPPGATVVVDGTPQTTPAQVVLPLGAGEQVLEFTLPGHRSRTEKVGFGPGQVSTTLHVALEPG
jgi:serine/threonine protein kinase